MNKIVYIQHVDQYGKIVELNEGFVIVDLLGDNYGVRTSFKTSQVEFISANNIDALTTRIHILDKDVAELFERNKQLENRLNALLRGRNEL